MLWRTWALYKTVAEAFETHGSFGWPFYWGQLAAWSTWFQAAFGPVVWSIGYLFAAGFWCLVGSKGRAIGLAQGKGRGI